MRIGEAAGVVSVVIPCLDEETAIGTLVEGLIDEGVDEVIVVDGGSRDQTGAVARAAGARVVVEPQRGYGRACATGIAATRPDAEVIAFIDGDGSDDPADMRAIIGPVMRAEVDFCVGSRLRGVREPGSLTPQQVVAGRLAGVLLNLTYGARFTDMAPLRAIRRTTLQDLRMAEPTFGWNLEMQMRVAARRLRIREVPVRCRPRQGGRSKISGNWRVLLLATTSLVKTFFRLALALRQSAVK